MKKSEEREHPGSCWNKAREGDFVFVLIDKDPVIADTIREWVRLRVERGINKPDDPKIVMALEEAEALDKRRG